MYIFARSCLDEGLPLCMGTPYCASKRDLKWCKNITLWGQADTKLKPIHHTKAFCKSSGQQIAAMDMNDKVYHCLNRGDETPYKTSEIRTSNQTDNSKKKTWLELVNEPCPGGPTDRRCLGWRADVCVNAGRKCYIRKFLNQF